MIDGDPAPWRLGTQTYTFKRFTLFEAIDKARTVGLKAIEGRPYKISADTGDAQLGPSAPPDALEKARKKLKDKLKGYL